MADRPYTLLSCGMSLDGYLDRPRRTAAGPVQRRRLRPGRRGARRVRRDPGGGHHDPQRRPAALSPVDRRRRADRLARGLAASPTKVTLTRSGRLDPGRAVLRDRRRRQAGLLPERGRARTAAAAGRARHRRRRRARRRPRAGRRGPVGARRQPADGRGRRHGQHAVPDRRPGRPAGPGRRTALRRRPAGQPVRAARRLPVDRAAPRHPGRGAPDRRRRPVALRPLDRFGNV